MEVGYDDLSSYISATLLDKVLRLRDRIIEEAETKKPEVIDNIYLEFGEYQQKLISDIFTEAIDHFYGSYDPFFYQRNESLYNILDMHPDEYGAFMDDITDEMIFNKSNVTAFERGGGSEGLYDRVFVGGYHGGATGVDHRGDERGYPSYREPYPGLSEKTDQYGPGGFFRWGKPAKHSESPHDEIMMKIQSSESAMNAELRKIARKHANRFQTYLRNKVKVFMREIF